MRNGVESGKAALSPETRQTAFEQFDVLDGNPMAGMGWEADIDDEKARAKP